MQVPPLQPMVRRVMPVAVVLLLAHFLGLLVQRQAKVV